jgi:predicted permease
MKNLINTLLLSLRLSFKAPLNTILCLFVLASGIALATSMFRICQIVLLGHVPYTDADRIVLVNRIDGNGNEDGLWFFNSYREYLSQQTDFSETLSFFGRAAAMRNAGGQDQRETATFVGTNFAEFTGIRPILGRSFRSEDASPSAERTAIINERLWRSDFGASPDIIGKTIVVDGIVRTVVGVMPEMFDGPTPLSGIQIWMPLNIDTLKAETGWGNYVSFLGKIRGNIPEKVAAAHAADISRRVYQTYREENRGMVTARLRFINSDLFSDSTQAMFQALFVCAILVLLMACGIASGLMTARYASRTQEFAIRTALGASRGQLVSQMVVEFLTISVASTLLGTLLDYWIATTFLSRYLELFGLPRYMLSQPAWPLVVFIIAVLVVATLFSTLMPALRASCTDISSILHESTRTGSSLRVTRLSNLIIVWQVASAGAILCGGMLMGYVIHKFSSINDYYDAGSYICAQASFAPNVDDNEKIDRVIRINDELNRHSELQNVGMSNEFFYSYGGSIHQVWIDGVAYANPENAPTSAMRIVSPGYFKSTNVPIMAGREFEREDDVNRKQVAIVTDVFAKQFYGTTDVIGKRFALEAKGPYLSIVGVVPDIYGSDGTAQRAAGFFVPYGVAHWQDIFFFAKGRSPSDRVDNILEEAIHSVDSRICVAEVMPISEYRKLHSGGLYAKFLFVLFSAFSVGALVMAAAGLYGIISFSVNSRKKDMGIRLALGATPYRVVMMVAKAGMINTGIGLFFAFLGTLAIRRIVIEQFSSLLPNTENWTVYATATAMLLVVTLASILIPAIRGAYVEPSTALRDE